MSIAEIRWPGPRPLSFDGSTSGGGRRLIGRDRELNELLDVCQTYAVVEITAASGVGKTSFVAGAKPHLERAGAKVVKAGWWSDVLPAYDALIGDAGRSTPDPVALYCLALGLERCATVDDLVPTLRSQVSEQPLVCVIDQFEELLRYRSRLGQELLEVIGRVAGNTGIPHVVVARSEYRNELHPVVATGAPTWHMQLTEIDDPVVIRRMITEPVPYSVLLEDAFADRVVDSWLAARETAALAWSTGDVLRVNAASGCGLLHLQALLWGFREWAVRHPELVPEDELTLATLETYAASRGVSLAADDGAELMADAVYGYVQEIVSRCTSDRWPLGPQLLLARATRHLSSAGFKLAQPASALESRAIQEELGSARGGQALDAWLREPSAGRSPDAVRRAKARAIAEHLPIEGAGLGAEWTPEDVAEEMLRSLDRSLDMLANDSEANLLRTFQNGRDPIYELVHDGVAPALNRWADDLLSKPQSMIGGVCSRRGIVFSQDIVADMFTSGGQVDPKWGAARAVEHDGQARIELSALRWHGLGIHQKTLTEDDERPVRIEGVVFRDCDFVGTLFRHAAIKDVHFVDCDLHGVAVLWCELDNVTFENCVLTGAAFNGCAFNDVTFVSDRADAHTDNLAIRKPQPGARVAFGGLRRSTGLFISEASGGTWSFRDVDVRHFLLTSVTEDPFTVTIDGTSRLRHATVEAPPDTARITLGPDVDHDIDLDALGDPGVIPHAHDPRAGIPSE